MLLTGKYKSHVPRPLPCDFSGWKHLLSTLLSPSLSTIFFQPYLSCQRYVFLKTLFSVLWNCVFFFNVLKKKKKNSARTEGIFSFIFSFTVQQTNGRDLIVFLNRYKCQTSYTIWHFSHLPQTHLLHDTLGVRKRGRTSSNKGDTVAIRHSRLAWNATSILKRSHRGGNICTIGVCLHLSVLGLFYNCNTVCISVSNIPLRFDNQVMIRVR